MVSTNTGRRESVAARESAVERMRCREGGRVLLQVTEEMTSLIE